MRWVCPFQVHRDRSARLHCADCPPNNALNIRASLEILSAQLSKLCSAGRHFLLRKAAGGLMAKIKPPRSEASSGLRSVSPVLARFVTEPCSVRKYVEGKRR